MRARSLSGRTRRTGATRAPHGVRDARVGSHRPQILGDWRLYVGETNKASGDVLAQRMGAATGQPVNRTIAAHRQWLPCPTVDPALLPHVERMVTDELSR